MQLASVYNELGDAKRALATLELAYAQDFLIRSNEIISLVSLYLDQGIPFKAAEILEKELKTGRVDATLNHYKMLASAWLQAQERDRAMEPLAKAAHLDETGKFILIGAGLHRV